MTISTGRKATSVTENAVKTNNVGVGRGIMDDIDQVVRLNLNGRVGIATFGQSPDQLRCQRCQSIGLLLLHHLHPIERQDQDALVRLPLLGGGIVIGIVIIVGPRMTKPSFPPLFLELPIKIR